MYIYMVAIKFGFKQNPTSWNYTRHNFQMHTEVKQLLTHSFPSFRKLFLLEKVLDPKDFSTTLQYLKNNFSTK